MYTAEFVSPKHPDKMCDQISDAVLDWALERDPNARTAIEVMGGHEKLFVTGELSMQGAEKHNLTKVIEKIANRIVGERLGITVNIEKQSLAIAKGVDTGGAGDQGIMKGYAVKETRQLMPREYQWARELCQYIFKVKPTDGKTQVTTDRDGKLLAIVASFRGISKKELTHLVEEWLSTNWVGVKEKPVLYINPAGDWEVGGFDADAGLTGRKIMVDNYGPRFAIGGGAFSGKDATKVDRSGAYIARKIAVELLHENDAQEVEVEIAYAIGVAEPVAASALVRYASAPEKIATLDRKYELKPQDIIRQLNLNRPQFEQTAKWGHFGNDFMWR